MCKFEPIEKLGYKCVTEWNTGCYWCPEKPYGFQIANGQPIALTSFGAFGSERSQVVANAAAWCNAAEAAWHMMW